MGSLDTKGFLVALAISLLLAGVPIVLLVRLLRRERKSLVGRVLGVASLGVAALAGLLCVFVSVMFKPSRWTNTLDEIPTPEPKTNLAAQSGVLVSIPGGTFKMGDGSTSAPARVVTVAPFQLDTTEVTVAAYAECVGSGLCTPAGAATEVDACNVSRRHTETHPINCVGWDQADAYCRSVGKRLPTEEEWEYAARGGAEDTTWSWGNAMPGPKLVCVPGSYMVATCPVGSFPRGAFGLVDMIGNVCEYTAGAPLPGDRASAGSHVVRGCGSASAASRSISSAKGSARNGFRCAK